MGIDGAAGWLFLNPNDPDHRGRTYRDRPSRRRGRPWLARIRAHFTKNSSPARRAKLIRSRRRLDARQLADPDIPLAELLETGLGDSGEDKEERLALGAWASEGGSL
jgi:hypothetical protein